MSELRDMLAAVVTTRGPWFADAVRNLRSGRTLTAEIEPVLDVEANVLLGRDARESVIFHVADRGEAAGIELNDTLAALGEKFRVLRRTDNPASPLVDFGAMKLTELDE